MLSNDASVSSRPIAEKPGDYSTKIVTEAARVEEVEILLYMEILQDLLLIHQ